MCVPSASGHTIGIPTTKGVEGSGNIELLTVWLEVRAVELGDRLSMSLDTEETSIGEPLDAAALLAVEFELPEEAAGVTVIVMLAVKIFVSITSIK
jgi:hypothetical protein